MKPLLAGVLAALAAPAWAAPDWNKVDAALGRPGTEQAGGVHRYGFPRSDLHVTLDGVAIKPALALGSWAEFQPMGDDTMVMGDLVLTHEEVNPVISRLLAGGFTITALLLLEDLGFCKKGEGGSFVEGGTLRYDGRLPCNTDGGGLSSNHSGMRGIFLVIEAVRQLRGGLGARQVEGAELAVAHGTGGYLGLMHSGATLVLSNS